MKKLTMLLLACALMALTNAAAVPEGKPEAVKDEPSVQEAAAEAEPVVEEPPAQEDLPEESEDMEMLQTMEENDSLRQRTRFCPYGWWRYGNRCFIYRQVHVTWFQAERNCQAKGGHLASICSFAEYNFIRQMIYGVAYQYPPTWIGASDTLQEGHWLWSDASFFHASYWCPWEPVNYRGRDCALMNSGYQHCWASASCFTYLPYVCVRDL